MKVIIAGSRNLNPSITDIDSALAETGWTIRQVISGTAKGVDRRGEAWSIARKVELIRMPANWNLYGNAAGFIRNEEMANAADALLAFWDGKSPGTADMIEKMNRCNKPVHIVRMNHVQVD